jgi:hypothetical protein
MLLSPKQRRHFNGGAAVCAFLLAVAIGTGTARSAGPPVIGDLWVSSVFSSTAVLSAEINPNGLGTTYHVDYIAQAAYEANVAAAKDGFSGGSRVPAVGESTVGSGSSPVVKSVQASSLAADTLYRYRFVAQNSAGTVPSPALAFLTQSVGGAALPDGRGWEMVSPIDKNGGQAEPPGALADGGVLQAAAAGGAVTYGSSPPQGSVGQGAATASQYLAVRTADGWSNQNVTAPLYSSSYNTSTEGVPYQLFSGDLSRALLLNGRRCRGEGTDCAVPNPPLAGTDAPVGYQNYYMRENGSFRALLGSLDAGFLVIDPSDFELRLAGAAADLRHGVLSTCAALTANAVEVTAPGGCDMAQTNLYEYSPGSGLSLVNVMPAQTQGTPGASLAAQSGAISDDGSRVYFSVGGNLYVREAAQTKQADADAGGGGTFEAASSDGSVAFFTKGGHLWRYQPAGAGSATDLTPSGGVLGVLGASDDGAYVYYQDSAALRLWHAGTTTTVAPGADASDASDYPAATGTARVSADGTHLLFLAEASLTGYDNKDLNSGTLDSQVYLYDAAGALTCISCNPTLQRPVGPSTVPGAVANGSALGSTEIYKPRVLSADGRRVFFDSRDTIGLADTNKAPDVYQWEAKGTGSCTQAAGCVSLISGGRSVGGASFVDASADGSDAFLLTDGSLIEADPGAVDLYDARVGGGFPVSPPPIVCNGDACQPLPSQPVDPTLTTLLAGPGNPAARYPRTKRKRCKSGNVRRNGFCVKKKTARKRKRCKHGEVRRMGSCVKKTTRKRGGGR